jgi:ABC-2 type transport system ATP-binding protein
MITAASASGLELEAIGLSRQYGDRVALAPIDLTVAPGTATALMGANGSGKTTLLRLLAGRDVASAGSLTLDGRRYSEDDEWVRRAVGVVAEDVAFYPDLSVREHLWLVASAHGAGTEIEAVTDDALSQVRLTDHGDAFPAELSSGQQQALLLATILVRPRRVLVLDEPERRLDPDARSRLADLLTAEREAGTTIVFATHHEELAKRVADQVVVLREGIVIASGTPAEINFGDAHGE